MPPEEIINCISDPSKSDVTVYVDHAHAQVSLKNLSNNEGKIYCCRYDQVSASLCKAKEYKMKYDGLLRIERYLQCMNKAFCGYLDCMNWEYDDYIKSYSFDKEAKITEEQAKKGSEYAEQWYDNLKLIVFNNIFKNDKIASKFQHAFGLMYSQLMTNESPGEYDKALNYILIWLPNHWFWFNGNCKRVRDLAINVLNPHVHGGAFIQAVIDVAHNKSSPPN